MSNSKFEERYQKLNSEQKKAVNQIDGPLLVVAGPGTGKTEILSLRVANILRQRDVYPQNILCVTFTNSASYNMRSRLVELIGVDAYKVSIQTFHSLGVEIMSSHPDYFYDATTFFPVDEITQIEILEKLIEGLEFDNELIKKSPDGSYTYLNAVKNMISYLKKEGLSPQDLKLVLDDNKKKLELINPYISKLFAPRISKAVIGEVEKFISSYELSADSNGSFKFVKPLDEAVIDSLMEAVELAEEEGTGPITKWKDNIKKDKKGSYVLKDTFYIDKLYSLVDLYKEYQQEMYRNMYYDYDDMIFNAIDGIKNNKQLQYELQDKYQYILVDEFQDTNGAQLILLDLITPKQDNKPNIMVVGDDDQAVYKFQGAELSNILGFNTKYSNNNVVPITKNYRSTTDILDVAKHIISSCEIRLTSRIDDFTKDIKSQILQDSIKSQVENLSFVVESQQYSWVATKINELIEANHNPSDIAVIARNHKHLEKIALILNSYNIPITYERNNNVLDEPHICQIIQICKFINSIFKKNMDEADEYLPEILSYPFWGIDRKEIWELSLKVKEKRGSNWLEVMQNGENKKLKELSDFFINLSVISNYESVENVIDEITGAGYQLIPDTEDDEEIDTKLEPKKFVSPFKEYYFSQQKLKDNSVEYIRFLSGLRTFIQAIRDYKKDKFLKIGDLIQFLELSEKNKLFCVDQSPFVNAFDAVSLLTAHKAKGSEFDTVFVINCQKDVWKPKKRGEALREPFNLPLKPAGDNEDDQKRLFYVAITRAKYNLFLCSYKYSDEAKKTELLPFILPDENDDNGIGKLLNLHENEVDNKEETVRILSDSLDSRHKLPVVHNEKAIIKKILENYRLSVTHLNNFLDVTNGGPQNFFEQNLLRFPQAKSSSGSFGSAIHRTIERIYNYLRKEDNIPDKDGVLKWFEEELIPERLNEKDHKQLLNKGRNSLDIFYDKRIECFDKEHYSEFNFSEQGVVVSGAHLTGKIDKIVKVGKNQLSVHDFKTGKPKKEWGKGTPIDKVLLHKYRKQLVFYKILVENSKNFGGKYTVDKGFLEFVEPDGDGNIYELPAIITQNDVEHTEKLIEAVHNKIMNMDFPDISNYKKNLQGIIDFEDDLIEGTV